MPLHIHDTLRREKRLFEPRNKDRVTLYVCGPTVYDYAQTLMGPIMMILVVPILVMQMALTSPDAPVVKVLSWIPFFTPFLMSARAPSDPPLIEVVLTLIGMFATAAFMVWIAGRAFRAGALSDVKLSWKTFGRAVTGRG